MGVSKWIIQVFPLLVLVSQPSHCSGDGLVGEQSKSGDWHDTVCVMLYCPFQLAACEFDSECRGLLDCMNGCGDMDAECAFTCGMTSDAGKNPHFLDFLYCVLDNHCTQTYDDSGVCLATDEEALPISDYSVVEGGWWTVYGQSCGQDGWTGAYDWYPCSHAEFSKLEDGEWINNTTYCSGADSVCEEIIVTVPKVYWSSPGVLRHDYPQEEAPLIPQIEDWKWLWISGDWALVIWCGQNPMLNYNGGFILSRNRSDGTIPDHIMAMLGPELTKYGLSLDEMCLTDSTQCTQVP